MSLVPSLTETLFALGAGDDVVGITDFCIFPENIDRAHVGGTKTPKIDRIRELKPDVVYVNIEENLKKHADEIATFAKVIATEPKTIDDVADLIAMLGRNHGREERAQELIDQLRTANSERRTFTFVVPIWKKPWMWCGGDTYVSHLVESAGGRNLLGDRQRYPAIALDEVLAMKPDVVFLPDEPYEFTQEDAESIAAPHPALRATLSRGRGRLNVIGPFPGHLFTWHGVRTIEGLKFLRRALRLLPPTAGSSRRPRRAASRKSGRSR
ncbi:MAG TPA: helical backbone metal receptor [Thermoanaerobaculia bacterium]|nr:helical backbone metal receptor [Thermoanaerobaculia bacterium]